MAEPVQWLSDEEQESWRPLVVATLHLFSRLDSELKASFDLSHLDYGIMAMLSQHPDHGCRMTELASAFGVDPSNITYHVRRLERRGLITRTGTPVDGRVVCAQLTDAGRELLQEAAPLHVEGVRRHFLDHVSADELRVIGAVFAQIRQRQRAQLE